MQQLRAKQIEKPCWEPHVIRHRRDPELPMVGVCRTGGYFQTGYTGQVVPSELRSPVNAMNPLKYRSGEEIRKGDRVLFHGHQAEIELVACDPDDPETTWHLSEYGGGVLVSDPKVSVRAFIPRDQLDEYEDLKFVSRAGS